MPLLHALLTEPIDDTSVDSIEVFWERYLALAARVPRTFDRAVLGGFRADRLAWAFAGGYRSALERLVPTLPRDAMASLAVSERGGNSPKQIATRLVRTDAGFVLEGDKTWTTLGPRASELLVAARVDAEGSARPELRVVRVRADAPGVTITPMQEMPFVPEIPHASVALRGVAVDERDVLLGDGYDDYVKPFRTVEDVHVFGAALGHAVRELRRRASPPGEPRLRPAIERALACLSALSSLADAPALAAPAHLALAGALSLGGEVYASLDALIADAADEAAVRLRRDRALLAVAGKAREARRDRAWEIVS